MTDNMSTLRSDLGPVPAVKRNLTLPLYDQLREAIVQMISSQGLSPGDLLPSEHRLCKEFEVSRTVVRQALAELDNQGLVQRVKGKGTFVAQPKTGERLGHTLMGLYEDAKIRGGVVHSDVLRHTTEPASAEVAELLAVASGSPVVVLQRMRFVDGEPWALSTAWLPLHVGAHIETADMTRESLYVVLARNGIYGATGWRSVEATLADCVSAKHLRTEPGSALLKLKSVRRDMDGEPFEYFEALHRGDHSRFEFELTPDETLARVRRKKSGPV